MKTYFYQKVISILMVVTLIFSMFSMQVFAVNDASEKSFLELDNLAVDNKSIPPVDDIEAWYGQQPVPNLNSDYVKYLQDLENGNSEIYDGTIPSLTPIIDGQFLESKPIARLALPSKYDPRGIELVTSVKNQGQRGICWSYGAVSTIESYLMLNNIERDYSENYRNFLRLNHI